jgi:O-antigen/teichoic acid export membrane protein
MVEGREQGRFLRDSLAVFGAQIVVTVLGVGTGVITARALGPRDRGIFQLLLLLPTTLSNFVKLGIPQANVYFMRRRGATASDVASNSLWLALALGGVLAFVCYLGRDWLLTHFLKGAPPLTLPPVLMLLPFVLVQTYFLGVLQAEERFGEYNFQQVAPTLLGLVGMAVALLWLRAGLLGAVVAQTAVVALVTIWLAVRVHRRARLRPTWNPELARGMLSFGGKSYLQTLASTLHFRIDQYMIAMLLNPTQVGYYAIAVNLTNLLLKIPDATGTVLFPRLAGAGDRDAHAVTSRVCRNTLFITVAGSLGYVLFGRLAIRLLYGPAYMNAVWPMLLMLPGVVMISLYLILTRNFTSRNRQQVNIIAAVAALAINVASNWVLIPRWGIAGAAVSTAISYTVAALILLVVFVRESGRSVGETVLVGRADLGSLARLAGRAAARGGVGDVDLRADPISDTGTPSPGEHDVLKAAGRRP